METLPFQNKDIVASALGMSLRDLARPDRPAAIGNDAKAWANPGLLHQANFLSPHLLL
jgi:hypothetical protein